MKPGWHTLLSRCFAILPTATMFWAALARAEEPAEKPAIDKSPRNVVLFVADDK